MARNSNIKLFNENGNLVKHITRRQAAELIREDRLDEIKYRGRFWGYMIRNKNKSHASSPMLTVSDILANVRITSGPVADEARISRAQTKIEYWPSEHDDRAPVVSAGHAFNVIEYTPPFAPLAVCSWPRERESATRVPQFRAVTPSGGEV